MKNLYLTLFLLSMIGKVYGQVETHYYPDSTNLIKINSVKNLSKSKKIKTFPSFDVQQLLNEDSLERIDVPDIPFRFGKGPYKTV